MMFDIQLAPQEESSNAKFDGQVTMTRGFNDLFEPSSTLLAINTLQKIIEERVNTEIGADYLQVAHYNNKKFWIFDDDSYVTFLLPSEY